MRQKNRMAISIGFLVGLVAAWAVPAYAQEPIKVGLLLTYVGPTALFARYEAKGARVLIDQVNKAGGIKGRPIELVGYDTEGKPDRAASLFRRLALEDKVVAVIGPDSIFVVLGMSSVPNEVKVPAVVAAGNYELIEPRNREYIVTAWGSGGYAMGSVIAHFKEKLRVNRIGMITTADAIGQLNVRMVQALGKLVGIEVVEAVSQPASDRDLLPSLRRLAAIKPALEGLMVFGSGPFGTIAINQTELAGLNVPVGYIGGNVIPELIKDVGPETGKRTYIATGRMAAPDTLPKADPFYETLQQFAKDYQALHGERPAMPSGVGYDMAMPIVEALKAVGPDPQKIRDHMRTLQQNLMGRQGTRFNRTPEDGYGTDPRDTVVVTIEGGKFVFKGYLKESFDRLGVKEADVQAQLREFKLIAR
jgi:branched-chain amino acid transport system substrate-binding protein